MNDHLPRKYRYTWDALPYAPYSAGLSGVNKAGVKIVRQQGSDMFWWFERRGQHVRLEVLEVTTEHFELRLIDVDGAEQVETFNEAKALAKRQDQLQQMLHADGWTGPHGWVI